MQYWNSFLYHFPWCQCSEEKNRQVLSNALNLWLFWRFFISFRFASFAFNFQDKNHILPFVFFFFAYAIEFSFKISQLCLLNILGLIDFNGFWTLSAKSMVCCLENLPPKFQLKIRSITARILQYEFQILLKFAHPTELLVFDYKRYLQ